MAVAYARMLASAADRDRAAAVLRDSFAEGRLTWREFEHRIGQVLRSRDFPEVAALIADLPVSSFGRMPAHRATPRAMSRCPRDRMPAEIRRRKIR
jgi:RNA polymerase-interacting CarD/CdnL/TRCF family regulator